MASLVETLLTNGFAFKSSTNVLKLEVAASKFLYSRSMLPTTTLSLVKPNGAFFIYRIWPFKMMATQIKRIAMANCRMIKEFLRKKLLFIDEIFPLIPVEIGTEIKRKVGRMPTTKVTSSPTPMVYRMTG